MKVKRHHNRRDTRKNKGTDREEEGGGGEARGRRGGESETALGIVMGGAIRSGRSLALLLSRSLSPGADFARALFPSPSYSPSSLILSLSLHWTVPSGYHPNTVSPVSPSVCPATFPLLFHCFLPSTRRGGLPYYWNHTRSFGSFC